MIDKYPNIEIKSNVKDGYTEIFIDGVKLKGVRSFELKQNAPGIPTLTVDLNAMNMSVDCLGILRHKGYGELKITLKDDYGNESELLGSEN